MNDDLPNFDVADQLQDDLLVKWLTDSNNTGFANNLETGTSVDEVLKTTSTWVFLQVRGFFYRLVRPGKCASRLQQFSMLHAVNRSQGAPNCSRTR
jgi:hypothetical protein